jgi:hypothetical protein
MAKGNTFETELLELIFNNTALPLIGDASGLQPSASAGSLFVALHTADPGEGGSQNTSEASYTGYARVAVARSGAGWIVTGNQVNPAAAITFPTPTAGSGTLTHASVGTDSSGAGKILYRGPIISPLGGITIVVGQPPILGVGTNIAEN